jgi:hypothetical protein
MWLLCPYGIVVASQECVPHPTRVVFRVGGLNSAWTFALLMGHIVVACWDSGFGMTDNNDPSGSEYAIFPSTIYSTSAQDGIGKKFHCK